jgi:hypothetical protein
VEDKDKVQSYEFDPEIVSKKMRWHKIEIQGDAP